MSVLLTNPQKWFGGPLQGQVICLARPAFTDLACRCSINQSAASKDRSGCQSLTAFRTTRINNGATALGGHACAEAMPAGTLNSAGLKSTLHDENLKSFYC